MDKPLRILALAPFVLLAHVVEEWFGFVEWFNRHADPDLSDRGFFSLTAVAALGAAPMVVQGLGVLLDGRRLLW